MFKRNSTKIKTSILHFKNVKGEDIILKMQKQGNTRDITLTKCNVWNLKLPLVICLLLANLIYLLTNITMYLTITAIIAILFIYKIVTTLKQESLIIVQSLGLQININYIIRCKTVFIPSNIITKIYINEVIHQRQIFYILSLLIKKNGEDKIIPLFAGLQPELACLEAVYKNLKDFR